MAESTAGQGSTFTIYFPVHKGILEQTTDAQNIQVGGKEYILFVDDEPSLALLGKRLLESLEYRTDTATDPLTALEMVEKNPDKYDLLITDMTMPNMTGEQLAGGVKKISHNMPTIICTGYSAKISEKEAAILGVSALTMKPLDRAKLSKIVRKILDEQKIENAHL